MPKQPTILGISELLPNAWANFQSILLNVSK